MKSLIDKMIEWLLTHNPSGVFTVIIVVCAIGTTSTIKDFQHRLDSFDDHLQSLNDRQQTTEGELKQIKSDIIEIKLFMKKIDTYLSTKDKDYPK